MTKAILVSAIASKANLTKDQAAAALDAFTSTVNESAAKGEKLTVPGLFSLEVRHVAAHKGRNVATGAEIDIAAKNRPTLKVLGALKAAANPAK